MKYRTMGRIEISAFIGRGENISRNQEGKLENTMELRGSCTAEIIPDGCEVPPLTRI